MTGLVICPNQIRIIDLFGPCDLEFYGLTTHLLSIQSADRPKLHDMFKACDANVWQREFPVGFPVEVSALNSIFINIFHDVVACIGSRCVIKAKHVLLVC